MKRLALLITCAALAVGAHATPQQDKMKACNAEAKDKKGDERKAFMKECLAAKPAGDAAAPGGAACEQSAKDKKLHGAAAKSHIKKCMADAASAPK
ncbi:PsiF family protein [Roseateles sp. BYS87W]|uniref:PsiF family protein n=1 Tax=Pelomonas baiyunensis TaxID=3299026 RepID=A0ABW7H1G3_9BURK